ncbi:ANFC protein, partial [Climacteris rufus]|nr:ANFC protein [Climacteris rufus]
LKLLFCPGFLLLLIVSQNQAGARSISSFQSLPAVSEEELEHPAVPAEREPGPAERWGRDTELPGPPSTAGEQLRGSPGGDGAIRRLLSDLLALARRHRARSKKGPPRGCFGVRLDRIGSLSGLGC